MSLFDNALGKVDACFANAGVSSKGTQLVDMDLEEFRRVQRVNVEGVFLTFRAAARHMVERGEGGSLVATASTAAVEGAALSDDRIGMQSREQPQAMLLDQPWPVFFGQAGGHALVHPLELLGLDAPLHRA